MSKKFKKILATLTVLSMMFSAMPMTMAEEGEGTPAVTESAPEQNEAPKAEEPKAEAPKTEEPKAAPKEEAPKSEPKVEVKEEVQKDEPTGENLTVTTTTTTDDNGKDTVTVTIEKEWTNESKSEETPKTEEPSESEETPKTEEPSESETSEKPEVSETVINGSETTVETTVTETTETDKATETTETTTTEVEGEEEREYTEDVQPGEEVPDVEVELKPGETTEGSVTTDPITETTTEGALPEGDEDFEYSETTTTTTIEREVEVTTDKVVVDVVFNPEEENFDAITPEISEDAYDNKENLITGDNKDMINGEVVEQPEEAQKGGYDYLLTGYGAATNAARAVYVDVVYKKDENGDPIKDENGEYIIESVQYTGKNGAAGDGMGSTPSIFALSQYKEDGSVEYFYGYCIDADTEAQPGSWYKVSNLEDSDYYPDDESSAKLRAIVTNGYWGSDSVAELKEALLKLYGEDYEITVDSRNPDKGTVAEHWANGAKDTVATTYTLKEIIEGLTDAEALTATQAAIWTYANGALGVEDGEDGRIIDGIYSVDKPKSNLMNTDRDFDYKSDARLKILYEFLIGLEGVPADSVIVDEEGNSTTAATTVINEKNNVKDMSLTIKDKAVEREENYDDDDDNDVYNTEVSFKLAFVPDPVNDDLLVMLVGQDNQPIKGADGKPIVRRLAGENSEGRKADTIEADENGVYVLTGLQLGENSNYTFDLRLEGTQYLKEGVYVYSAFGGSDASQTMVGMGKGTHDVDVSVGMTISFNVDEQKKVTAKRSWKSKTTKSTTSRTEKPGSTPNNPTPNNPTPADPVPPVTLSEIIETITEEAVPLAGEIEIIVDEEVPMDELLTEIPDEEVPLAAVPQTGDGSAMMAMMSLLSLLGIILLSKKREFVR